MSKRIRGMRCRAKAAEKAIRKAKESIREAINRQTWATTQYNPYATTADTYTGTLYSSASNTTWVTYTPTYTTWTR